jgi:hypothetical protein
MQCKGNKGEQVLCKKTIFFLHNSFEHSFFTHFKNIAWISVELFIDCYTEIAERNPPPQLPYICLQLVSNSVNRSFVVNSGSNKLFMLVDLGQRELKENAAVGIDPRARSFPPLMGFLSVASVYLLFVYS